MSRRHTGLAATALGGAALVVVARLLNPAAPPLYDGVPLPTPPYRYVSPPQDLASSNQKPLGGTATLNADAAGSTVETGDRQVVAYFGRGVIQANGAGRIKLTITPVQSPPPPPAGATYAGNAYEVAAFGEPGDVPIAGLDGGGGQLLMRVPPLPITNAVEVRSADGTWKAEQWGAQPDFVNVSLDRFGVVAAFNVPGRGSGPAVRGASLARWAAPAGATAALLGLIGAVTWYMRRSRRGSRQA